MTLATWAQADVPAEIERQVLALSESAWPSDGPPRTPRHDPRLDPVTMVNVKDDVVVASLSILSTTITHGGSTYWGSGLSAVVTDGELRGQGHGLVLIRAANELIRSWGVDLSVFTCDRELCAFYERGGWQVIEGSYLVGGTPEEPLLSNELGKVLMLDLISKSAQEHAAEFDNARIELYPGPVDKLW